MMLTEPKAALAGVMIETSFARFKVSMATFNEERTLFRRCGCGALGFMGSKSTWRKRTSQPAGCEGEGEGDPEPWTEMGGNLRSAQTEPFKPGNIVSQSDCDSVPLGRSLQGLRMRKA